MSAFGQKQTFTGHRKLRAVVVQSVGFGDYNRRKPSTERCMRLYLVQHGEAVAKEVDPDRPMVYFQPGSVAGLERDDSRTWRITLLIGPGLLDSVI